MKVLLAGILALSAISNRAQAWSADGHQVTAIIALKFLDEHGKKDVAARVRAVTGQIVTTYFNNPVTQKSLLNCKQDSTLEECKTYLSIAAASIFPDKVKHEGDHAFDPTASWHFINTDNQTYNPREALVNREDEYTHKVEFVGDLYVMINGLVNYLKTFKNGKGDLGPLASQFPAAVNWTSQCSQRPYGCETEALSFLIHLVGDIHQPLHVSSACDLGGNKVHIKLYGKDTNSHFPYELHAAWDGDLFTTTPNPTGGDNIEEFPFNDMALMADALHLGSPTELGTWIQQTDPKVWADESLSYAPQIYNFSFDNSVKKDLGKTSRKVAQATGTGFRCPTHPDVPLIGLNYRNHFLPLMKRRLLQGGVRLAGLLNAIYGTQK